MKAPNGQRIYVQEVSTRDGLQIEPIFVPTAQKIALIDRLSLTGLAKIEVTSFVSPKAIPALADAEAVVRGIARAAGVEYAALVPNVRGAERAVACQVDEITVVISASETHNQANLRMTREQSLTQIADIVPIARGAGVPLNVSLSTTFGCPFEGDVPESTVLDLVGQFAESGAQGVSLCDTTGMANPAQVERLAATVQSRWPNLRYTAHFHNTRGMALPNVLAALETGIDRFDASLGGLGGCPFAPGATGNVCTEDLVHMLQSMGYNTGVNLAALLDIAHDLPAIVGHDVPGQVMKAGPASRRYAKPDWVGTGQDQTKIGAS